MVSWTWSAIWKLLSWTAVSCSRNSPVRRQEIWAVQAIRATMPTMATMKAINLIFIAPRIGSKQRSAQDHHGDGKINNQTGDIHQRGDEWCGGRGGVQTEAAQGKWQHRAGERPPKDDANQRKENRQRNEHPVRSIDIR